MAPFRNGVVLYNKAVTKGMEQKVLNWVFTVLGHCTAQVGSW